MEIHTSGYHPKIDRMMRGMELRQKIKDERWKNIRRQQMVAWYWNGREALAMMALMHIDKGWEAWYDDNNNVPETGSSQERTMLIERRIQALIPEYKPAVAKLHRGVFVWTERYQYGNYGSACLIDDYRLVHDFDNAAAAHTFIDRLESWQIVSGTFKDKE
jgi:hypothetical protein